MTLILKTNIVDKTDNFFSVLKNSKLIFLQLKNKKSNLTFHVPLALRPNNYNYNHYLYNRLPSLLERYSTKAD